VSTRYVTFSNQKKMYNQSTLSIEESLCIMFFNHRLTSFYYEKKNLSENIVLFYPIPSGDADWVCCETTELDAC